MEHHLIQKKICLLGMFGVGKTSLVRRFVYNRFDDSYLVTVGVKVSQKILPPVKNRQGRWTQFEFLIWDIAGFEEAGGPTQTYFLGASGALVVADLSRPYTIDVLPKILDSFFAVAPAAKIVLLGNKKDLFTQPEEQGHSLQGWSEEKKWPFLLTSAKTGENVEKAFLALARTLVGEEQ
ncbi:MAG: GTP-binding protein [Calditrichaeota bacterium]|nr:GTP-binding protein [Calditrichota bacterium]